MPNAVNDLTNKAMELLKNKTGIGNDEQSNGNNNTESYNDLQQLVKASQELVVSPALAACSLNFLVNVSGRYVPGNLPRGLLAKAIVNNCEKSFHVLFGHFIEIAKKGYIALEPSKQSTVFADAVIAALSPEKDIKYLETLLAEVERFDLTIPSEHTWETSDELAKKSINGFTQKPMTRQPLSVALIYYVINYSNAHKEESLRRFRMLLAHGYRLDSKDPEIKWQVTQQGYIKTHSATSNGVELKTIDIYEKLLNPALKESLSKLVASASHIDSIVTNDNNAELLLKTTSAFIPDRELVLERLQVLVGLAIKQSIVLSSTKSHKNIVEATETTDTTVDEHGIASSPSDSSLAVKPEANIVDDSAVNATPAYTDYEIALHTSKNFNYLMLWIGHISSQLYNPAQANDSLSQDECNFLKRVCDNVLEKLIRQYRWGDFENSLFKTEKAVNNFCELPAIQKFLQHSNYAEKFGEFHRLQAKEAESTSTSSQSATDNTNSANNNNSEISTTGSSDTGGYTFGKLVKQTDSPLSSPRSNVNDAAKNDATVTNSTTPNPEQQPSFT